MLCDWVTVKLSYADFPMVDWRALLGTSDRIQRYNPATGEVSWEKSAWESIRSDSHGVTYRFGADCLWVQGSPARAEGDGCNVFGGVVSQSLDLMACAQLMISHVSVALDTALPPAKFWRISRADITGNLALPSLPDVRVALKTLRGVEGGRYKVSNMAGDTVYWSSASKLRSGKAYAKGPHLRHLNKVSDQSSQSYTDDKIALADRLLRLELKLGSQFWRELEQRHDISHWSLVSSEFLVAQWSSYFSRMLGSGCIDMSTPILDKLLELVPFQIPSEGQARAAYGLWLMIQSVGWESAHFATSKPTWYRNLKHLRAAGLGDADFSSGSVVSLRRHILVLEPVTSWELLRAA